MENINNILNDIYNLLNDKSIKDYKIDNILNLSPGLFHMFLENITNYIINTNHYKYTNYRYLFEFLVDIILLYNKNQPINLNNNINFIIKLSCMDKGQFLLQKIKNLINFTQEEIYDILQDVSKKGTLPIYFFWKNKLTIMEDHIFKVLLEESSKNNDNRIFKFLLLNENIDNKNNLINSSNVLHNILNNIYHPKKVIYRKVKLLSEYINISKIFNDIIIYFSCITTFFDLEKYYYKELLTFNSIKKLYSIIYLQDYENILNKFFNKLKTQNEKNMLIIINSIYNNFEINHKLEGNIDSLLINNYKDILEIISFENLHINANPIKNYIIYFYSQNKYFNKYLLENTVPNFTMILYTRFYVHNPLYQVNIQYNKLLHLLRLHAKKIVNKRLNIIKLNYQPILNEIRSYKPNNQIKVLNNGSLKYQQEKHKFTTLPPRHILPNEINFIQKFIIKEKSDGILVNNLPINVMPLCEEFKNHNIKAEYIEEHELYLVFDIDLPNTTIIERQNFIRILHPFTRKLNNFQNIQSIKDLIFNIEYERHNIISYLNNTKDTIKWYPKACFKVNEYNSILIDQLNNFVEEKDIIFNNYIIKNGIIKNDGFIITPLESIQELKIKPKSLMTIDLLFDGNKWKDSNNIIWKNIILSNKKLYNNKIYRCYPSLINKKLFFTAKEIRYDKKKPNSNKICSLIANLYEFNWNKPLEYNNIYYQTIKNKTNKDNIDKEIYDNLNSNKNFLINLINDINPKFNLNWLDLGCGKCKIFENLKNYNPKHYLGIDIDINCIIKANDKYNNNDNIKLYLCNLKENWNITNYKITKINDSIKYDYIIANFSLMHFCCDLFWEQLNNIVNPNALFIFNIVKENINWNHKNNYLKCNNDKCHIYFSWVHNNELIENLITEKILINYLKKYKWNIVNKIQNNEFKLTSAYNWYIIQKI